MTAADGLRLWAENGLDPNPRDGIAGKIDRRVTSCLHQLWNARKRKIPEDFPKTARRSVPPL